jgi:SAM-dependent methyltransferase
MHAGIRRLLQPLRRTPLHPQWLLSGSRRHITADVAGLRGTVLDVGCADRWIESALPAGCHYVGVDYPATGARLYGACPHVFADAAELPLRDASVDAVVMIEVLEHLRRPAHALREAARVLRPGGHVYLTVPFLYPVHDAPHDFQRFTEHGLERELVDAGLEKVHLQATRGPIETAGLLACLALAGSLLEAVRRRHPGVLAAPLVVLAIPLINSAAWLLGRCLPAWDALPAGYRLLARRP